MANNISKNTTKRSGKYRIAVIMNNFKINKKISMRHSFYKKKCQCVSCAKSAKLSRNQTNRFKGLIESYKSQVVSLCAFIDANYNSETNDTTDCNTSKNTGLLWQQITDSSDNSSVADDGNESVCNGQSSDNTETADTVANASHSHVSADGQTSELEAKLIELVAEIKRMQFSETCEISLYLMMALLSSNQWNVAVAKDSIIKGIHEYNDITRSLLRHWR